MYAIIPEITTMKFKIMRKKVLSFWILFIFVVSMAKSQNLNILSGIIQDNDKAGIPGASIYLLNTNFEAILRCSNKYGQLIGLT